MWNLKRLPFFLILAAVLALAGPLRPGSAAAGLQVVVQADFARPLGPIARALLGQTISTPQTEALTGAGDQVATARVATHLRGLYAAFYADYYDWRDPLGLNDPLRPDSGAPEIDDQLGTLDYLRLAQANQAGVTFNVNTRGVRTVFDHPLVEDVRWVMTDTAVLADWAADWVHYTNYTLQHFDTARPPDPAAAGYLEAHSAAILASLAWRNRDGSGERPVLPEPGEQLPLVEYWEIGNEPNFPLTGFRLGPVEFAQRYLAITEAMIARDVMINGERTIQVGPSLNATYPPNRDSIQEYVEALEAVGAVVDFVAYHPYTTLYGDWRVSGQGQIAGLSPARAEDFGEHEISELRAILSALYGFHESLAFSTTLAAPAGVELWVNEWNPSSWESAYVDEWKAMSMAQSLGALETLFSFARLGVDGATFFTDPAFLRNDRRQPLYQTFRFLEWALGDELVAVEDGLVPEEVRTRAYVTRHAGEGADLPGAIVLWMLNWSEGPAEFDFQLRNLDGFYVVGQVCRLVGPSLLHGAVRDPDAPPLNVPLRVECEAQAEGVEAELVGGWGLDVRVEAPANGWTAVILWPEGREDRD